MELKQFISETLSSIVEGVVCAQKSASPYGARIIPGGLSLGQQALSGSGMYDSKHGNVAQVIEFDVALTVEAETAAKARIGVLSGLLNTGIQGSAGSREHAVNRIRFTVPILFPTADSIEKKTTT